MKIEKLPYSFNDPELLTAALTHRSMALGKNHQGTAPADGETDNQRLEFLGDAVLDLFISEFLFHHKPRLKEGDMSRIRAGLVCETRLTEVARGLGLGDQVILGAGEAHGGGRSKHSVLADALEAVLGAIYLDGGREAVWPVMAQLWAPYLESPELWGKMLADYKTKLQEVTQGLGLGVPRYELLDSRGPAHARLFTMGLWLGDEKMAQAEALSKKEAEQEAAKEVLSVLAP